MVEATSGLKRNDEITTVRMPGHPWPAIVCLLLLGILVALMLTDAGSRPQISAVLVLLIVTIALSFTTKKAATAQRAAMQKEKL